MDKYSTLEDYDLTEPEAPYMFTDLDSRPRRQLKLTEKGSSLFQEQCDVYIHNLLTMGRNLETLLHCDISVYEGKQLYDLGQKLNSCFDEYRSLSDEYLVFLSRHNTHESALEQSSHMVVRRTYMERAEMLACSISKKLSVKTVTPSQKSLSSVSRYQRSVIQKRLSLEATKARLDFVKKENELKQHALKIQTELEELAV